MKNLRQYFLFKTHTDTELSKKWNISNEWVRRLRIEKGYSNISSIGISTNRKIKKLKEYLKKNKNKPFSVAKLKKEIKIFIIDKNPITTKFIIDFCKKNKIKLTLPIKNKHGYSRYTSKLCKCEICKLANTLKARTWYYNINCSIQLIDKIANKYYKIYKNDKSKKRVDFYQKIDSMLNGTHRFK